jgi:nitroimidazol reductase NimA-like FMN-containing flavoprotein (pyridoxamine 5'-phosphate oxidase superfamily)
MRKMTNESKQMTSEEAEQILAQGEIGVLATVDREGQPYGVPLNYGYIEGAIYFHGALEGHKLDNIRENDRVSFTVIAKALVVPEQFTTHYESVILFGTATVVTDEAEKIKAMSQVVSKYSPEFLERGLQMVQRGLSQFHIVRLNISHMTGKRNG